MTLTVVLVVLGVIVAVAAVAVWQDRRERRFDADLARIQRDVEAAAVAVGMTLLPALGSMAGTVEAMLAVSAELRTRGVV